MVIVTESLVSVLCLQGKLFEGALETALAALCLLSNSVIMLRDHRAASL